MKKFFPISIMFTVMIALIVLSSGCSGSEEYRSPDDLAKERQSEIMECFVKKDGETLKSFFSEYINENYSDIDVQIKTAFDFLDGEIISYDEPFSSALGNLDEKYYGGDTRNIITDKDTEYRIIFHSYLTNDKEPKKVGISCITIINMTEGAKLPHDASESDRNETRVYIGEPQ
ncbi:MAG: DUF5104 domain-containing protein [Ruminococcaceae bacterium]|nr:DUF5104 domain-containing protein [Oscillospiraceae bacterium]